MLNNEFQDCGIIMRQGVFKLYLCFQNYFARNFYNMRMLALFVAFAINFILLFYKVCSLRCCF